MGVLLPPDLLQLISQQLPCRDSQILQLATYFNGVFPSPAVLVAHGLEHTSKKDVIVGVLERRGIDYAVLRSRECLSQRHLVSKVFAAALQALGLETRVEQYGRVDSINALLENLRKLSEHAAGRRFVVVLEDTDKLKQAGATLLPALARLGDYIPGFSIIMTSGSPQPLILHRTGVPHIHFPSYTRREAVYIITAEGPPPLSSCPPETTIAVDEKAISKLYAQFALTVYDSLIAATSSTSIPRYRSTCHKLWPRFIWPLVSGQEPPGTGTGRGQTWDFAKLIVQNRALFQLEGERALHRTLSTSTQKRALAETDSLGTVSRSQSIGERGAPDAPSTPSNGVLSASGPPRDARSPSLLSRTASTNPPLLKHFSTLILVSSYLASHTLPKHDILLFSRLSSSSATMSRKIRRLRQMPTKRKSTSTPTASPSKNNSESKPRPKTRAKSLFAANAGLGVARPFTLERLVAILRAVHPHGIPNRPGHGVSDRVYRELGELEKLRLVVRASGPSFSGGSATLGSSSTSAGGGDDGSEERWRVNVSRDWVVDMGKVWGMGISEYEIDQES
ncbi:hypothetical protein A1O3_00809 [Capronia epimyces CBS 606.96]|uniref:Uncharacterized protein n=1 Tax=Capronia epimyces CBS 606.96 TaxID=1182542 RepID=W9ZCK3_9EURO|nr:uncharacterized protein A1O3_00809 [Capronia epimyces CBS 606.96]EXJ92259.1 hypothetical protein A1O3_00809 [Capronia epimyces CBS 606.96]